jgi:hypothetical protein
MARSDRSRAILAAGAVAALLIACNALVGLDEFDKVECARDCGAAPPDQYVPPPDEAGPDAPPMEASIPLPDGASPTSWARWIMPNPPDAGGRVGSDFDYVVNGDASVLDNVTRLEWALARDSALPSQFDKARAFCKDMSPGAWRLPTRIELVTLIDYTRYDSAHDGRFPQISGWVWTSSVVRPPTLPYRFWSVNFTTGEVGIPTGSAPLTVLCVRGS